METEDYSYLDFTPKPLTTALIKPAGGLTIKTPINCLPLIFARINYESYRTDLNAFNKISIACSVALFTRTADTFLIDHYAQQIQSIIRSNSQLFRKFNSCDICLKQSCNHNTIRSVYFPELKTKRENANDILHILDKSNSIVKWPVKEVFDYCYELYQSEDLIYGDNVTIDLNEIRLLTCKSCNSKR